MKHPFKDVTAPLLAALVAASFARPAPAATPAAEESARLLAQADPRINGNPGVGRRAFCKAVFQPAVALGLLTLVTLPDKSLESLYWQTLYRYGCTTRAGRCCVDTPGIWF